MFMKIATLTAGMCIAGFAAAGVASADHHEEGEAPPPPSSDDVSSFGTIGDTNMGFSAGMGGWASWSPLGSVETSGWPVSRTQISSPMIGNYDATTNYDLAGGEIEHWSTLEGDNVAFNNHAEYYYGGMIEQEADVRFGSTQIKCVDFMCSVVE